MKKSLLLILTVISFSLYGQNSLKSSTFSKHDGSSWNKTGGVDYEYDTNENLISETYYDWDGTAYNLSSKTIYDYNSNNKITDKILKVWNNSTNNFNILERDASFYDTAGELTEIIRYIPYASGWEETDKQSFTHFNSNITRIEYSYLEANQWKVDAELIVYYLENKIIQGDINFYDGSQWEDVNRYVVSYDANGKITNTIFEYKVNSVWTDFNTFDYNLDANFNHISEYVNNIGPAHFKVEYDYDLSAQMVNYAHPFKATHPRDYMFKDFPFTNKILTETTFSYDTLTSDYVKSRQINHNYDEQLVLSTDNIQQMQNFSLYPNPANDFIQINGITKSENITIHNISGVQVHEQKINDHEKLNIQSLANGLYLLNFENGTILKFMKN